MRTFGPFYPQAFQSVISHAERLVGLLAEEEGRGGGNDMADAWLAGRAGEVERFVESLVADWREGRRSCESAADVVREYLKALHDGMAEYLHIPVPECCADAAATVPGPGEARPEGAVVEPLSTLHGRLGLEKTRLC
jgi:hypothetical protein